MFKIAIKPRLFLSCCVLASFLFAIIQVSIVHAATQQTQTSQIDAASPTPIPTPTPTPEATPTPTPTPEATPTPTTVAQPVNVTLSPTTVQAGKPVTISGENWLPAQQLTVQIAATGQSDVLVQGTPSSNSSGHFSISLTIPPTATPGTYAIIVFASNQQSLHFEQDSMLTVTAPTETVTPTSTPSPTATVTPTPNGSNGNGSSGLTILTFILGGLGVILIITGLIMFAASSPTAPAR